MPDDRFPKDASPGHPAPGRHYGRTLYRDLILSIILVVAGAFILVVSLTYAYFSHQTKVQGFETLSEFGDYLKDSLELPIWNYEDEGIIKICGSFFENAMVEKLVVRDSDGKVLFNKHRGNGHSIFNKRITITHADQVVGHIEIALNHRVLRERQNQLMWVGLIGMSAVILVLMITLRVVLKVFLLAPLSQLIQGTEQISRGDYRGVDLQAAQLEIRTIVARFNHMAEQIQHREQTLREVNQRLEKEIAEHREAESALLNSQQELDSIIRSTPDIIYRLDKNGCFTFVSEAIRRYGVTPELLIGKAFLDYIHPDDREIAQSRINERRTGSRSTQRLAIHAFGAYGPQEGRLEADTGYNPVFLVDAEGLYTVEDSGQRIFVGTQGIARDITNQRKMESLRRESEERLLLALDVSGAGIWQMSLKSNALQLDDRIAALLGYTASDLALGMEFIRSRITPETWHAIQHKYERHISGKSAVFDHEFCLQATDGQWRWFHTKARVIRQSKKDQPETMVGIIVDTSERKESEAERERLEMKLQQALKMEAIGTLAGGIAHDFNNILGAIYGYTQLTQMHAGDNPRIKGYVDNIFKASERAKGLVEQILTFTRQGKSQKVPSDIAIVLKEAVKLIRASIPSTINIVQQIPTSLGTVMADQTQIHQVLMNLCSNAAHAMEASGGQLTVTLETFQAEPGWSVRGDDLPPGQYLQLSVSDTGSGMEKAVMDRIFDPYFTTKPVGEGTGMGLATVHGIINDHGGRIFVESQPGKGSTFRVLFPVLESPTTEAPLPGTAYPLGDESILFVDDEEILVKVGLEMLADLGYDAVGTTHAVHALELFTADPDRFDLIITDMTMPDMTGDQLAAQILQHRTDIPIIICTGYSKHMSSERASALGIRAFLMKPVSVAELARTIRQVLDPPAETTSQAN